MPDKQPFAYYLELIRNGEVLTDVEISNAKKLCRITSEAMVRLGGSGQKASPEFLEKCMATVRENRDERPYWNQWYHHNFWRTADEEVR